MKISFIVPIYNAEKTLTRCLKSLISINYNELEFILINDGSIDGSLKICKYFADVDKRIKIIDNNNNGVSYSRNEGIRISTGDYLFFLDADDWLSCINFSEIIQFLDNNYPDILFLSFYKEFKNRSEKINLVKNKTIALSNDKITEFNIYNTRFIGTVWGKFYKKDLIMPFQFSRELKFCEDAYFNYSILSTRSCTCMYLDVPLYHYTYNLNSTIHRFTVDHIENYKKALIMISDIVNEKTKSSYENFFCEVLAVIIINGIFNNNNKEKLKHKFDELDNIYQDDFFSKLIKKVKYYKLGVKKSIFMCLIKLKSKYMIWLLSVVNNLLVEKKYFKY